MAYKVIYDRENCIGANSCVGVLPEFWSLDESKKAVLKGSSLDKSSGRYELVIEEKDWERLKESALVCPVSVIDIIDLKSGKSIINPNSGKEVEKESAPVIQARYDSSKEWKEDPKGFFMIKPNAESGVIKVLYYGLKHQLLFVIEGKTAEEIYNTIAREGFVSSLPHAAYLGSELQKAETALRKGIPYKQDEPLL